MTHRQFQAWTDWDLGQWNVPDRHDWYVMQLTAATVSTEDKPRRAHDCVLKFSTGSEQEHDRTKQEAQFKELAQQGWRVPRRLTKEDVVKLQAWYRTAELGMGRAAK